MTCWLIVSEIFSHLNRETEWQWACKKQNKACGSWNDFKLPDGFPITFSWRTLAGSVGNDNHMTVADHGKVAAQQHGSTETTTTLPKFGSCGSQILDVFWKYLRYVDSKIVALWCTVLLNWRLQTIKRTQEF